MADEKGSDRKASEEEASQYSRLGFSFQLHSEGREEKRPAL